MTDKLIIDGVDYSSLPPLRQATIHTRFGAVVESSDLMVSPGNTAPTSLEERNAALEQMVKQMRAALIEADAALLSRFDDKSLTARALVRHALSLEGGVNASE